MVTPFFPIYWNTETTSGSVPSSFWYTGSSPSHELSQLGGVTEVQSSESQVLWPPKPKEINGNVIHNSSCGSSIGRPEGLWPPSVNVSFNLFHDLKEDGKTVSTRSILSGYNTSLASRPSNSLISDQVEKGKRTEVSIGCRLFGIDLTSNSKTTLEKSCPSISSTSVKGPIAAAAVSEADRIQNLEASKSSNDQKQVLPDASQKDTQGKQICTPSSRTRTKVKPEPCKLYAGSLWIFESFNVILLFISDNNNIFILMSEQVQMQGVAVGRAVDLTALEGYDELISDLEKMFDIKGELCPRNKWEVVFTDDEGDMMLVGDDPWQ